MKNVVFVFLFILFAFITSCAESAYFFVSYDSMKVCILNYTDEDAVVKLFYNDGSTKTKTALALTPQLTTEELDNLFYDDKLLSSKAKHFLLKHDVDSNTAAFVDSQEEIETIQDSPNNLTGIKVLTQDEAIILYETTVDASALSNLGKYWAVGQFDYDESLCLIPFDNYNDGNMYIFWDDFKYLNTGIRKTNATCCIGIFPPE